MKDMSPLFEEGLYLASVDFWNELGKSDARKEKTRAKQELSLDKYWLRSCVRCTPYGTFAGCAVVDVGAGPTSVILNEDPAHKRHIRLDMNYMTEIIQAITRLEPVMRQLKLFKNNSLYELPNYLRYVEYGIKSNSRKYHISSIEKTGYLMLILERASKGASIEELIRCLMSLEEVTYEEAAQFIMDIWNAQLLISELDPCVTGMEPLDQLLLQLASFDGIQPLKDKLTKIQQLINDVKEGVDHYLEIESHLKALGLSIQVPRDTLQTDLFLSLNQGNINEETARRIVHQVNDLLVFSRRETGTDLKDFKNRFYAKYDDQEVPLSMVLDPDHGIGFTAAEDEIAGENEIVENLGIAQRGVTQDGDYSYIQQFVLSKYIDFIAEKKDHIEISEEDIKRLKGIIPPVKIPNSLFVVGNLLKTKNDQGSAGFQFNMHALTGPSAATLLGRFAHGDSRLAGEIKQLLEQEEAQYPDAIYAEIVHLPNARLGNVLLRPVLRNYEIPYVGRSGAKDDSQIGVNDLYVSIRNDEIVLRSARYNKRVIPRLTTAHNFKYRSLPIYHFLCSLQTQGINNMISWDWGHLNLLKNLPRVTYKNIIVQKATWRVVAEDIEDMPRDAHELNAYFKEFRRKLNLPSRVLYVEGDNQLLVDFEDIRGINLFTHYLKKNKRIVLTEFVFDESDCFVKNKLGMPFTNELVIPIYQEATASHSTGLAKFEPGIVQRKFSPYSEWLYCKVYCGVKTADKLLKNVILPFVENGLEEKLFEHFFFVRYRDDFPHFRIRFFNRDTSMQLPLYKSFMEHLQPFLADGTIDKIIVDTYVRELERYDADWIGYAEQLFSYDSLAILRFINILDEQEDEKYRLLFSIRSIDMLLGDFDLSLDERHDLMSMMQSGYFKEFGGQSSLRKNMNEKYRKYQPLIFSHMNPSKDAENGVEEAVKIFRTRSEENGSLINRMILPGDTHAIKEKIMTVLPSFIHMSMNRMFVDHQRKHELVVYHFMEKYYSSRVAIEQKAQVVAGPNCEP